MAEAVEAAAVEEEEAVGVAEAQQVLEAEAAVREEPRRVRSRVPAPAWATPATSTAPRALC